ncbi:phytoene/squalene synthase family protein [Kitasatospora sp. NPDC048540]|uniref:phytoene/squalene synthase family protein n=1 Tax=unclassified Kitasatospora TaxID=2633591 RepID=UPI000539ED51|nr:phytoene/squalene synthase family protein [Kitasatospora sp. MBT63]
MSDRRRALSRAGIDDPRLQDAYLYCRHLAASHGRTYYLATRLLPAAKRPHVHALYGFARFADEIVDNEPEATRAAHFDAWSAEVTSQLRAGRADQPVARALLNTMRQWEIPIGHVDAFLASMRADLTVTRYRTFEDLSGYVYGSAAVIGLQLIPILEPLAPEAADRARVMGEAFQLSNFLRDVAEDYDRGRIYLPQEDLERFAVSEAELGRTRVSRNLRDLLRYEIDRNRRQYAYAVGGIPMLAPSSRPCIETAFTLYGGILEAIESADYQILDRRVSVPPRTRVRVAARAWRQAGALRRSAVP